MATRWIWRGALALVALCAAEPGARALQRAPPGPFPVGFRIRLELDTGRRYRTAFDEGATYDAPARPILMELWYPAAPSAAKQEHMPYERHLAVPAPEPGLAAFAAALGGYARGVFVQEVTEHAEGELTAEQALELGALLEARCACVFEAEPAPGRFPLVVYHSGAGSSFEDNAGLCEYLASHGYVVAASAYPEGSGASLGIDGGRGSSEDMHFLVRRARELAFVAPERVALVGHSAGAQAAARCAAVPGCVADALVLLDTTQDYYAPSLPLHETLVREVRAGVKNLTVPMLVAAGPGGMFALMDELVGCERAYLTVPELDHDEFISQGMQRLDWLAALGTDAAPARSARTNYAALCERVRLFLDAQLKGEAAGWSACVAHDRTVTPGGSEPSVELAARGVEGPEPWQPGSGVPPTPRQFRRVVLEQGAEAACAVLERFDAFQPRGPLYTGTMLGASLLFELREAKGAEAARALYGAWKKRSLAVLGTYQFLADIGRMQGKPEQARAFLRLAHELEPEDSAVNEALHALEPEAAPR